MTALPNVPVWEDGSWAGLPALVSDVVCDACVVGLGASGLSAVAELVALGMDVVGIDAGMVGGGAAGRNGGFLLAGMAKYHHDAVAAWGEERATALYRETLDELDRCARELGPAIVRRAGSLRVPSSDDEAEDCARMLAALRASGLPAEDFGDGTVLLPTDAATNPLARCRAMAAAVAGSARLFERSPVTWLSAEDVVTGSGAAVRSRTGVVVAVDGGLERLLPETAPDVRSTRLQMLATAPVTPVLIPRPVYMNWGYDYAQQLPDGRIALGGARDRHHEAEWGAPAEPSAAVQADIERILRDVLHVDAPVTHRWAGEVSYTPDRLPLLAEVRPGVFACGAYSGHGNLVGALCGRAAARRLAGEPSRWWDLIRG